MKAREKMKQDAIKEINAYKKAHLIEIIKARVNFGLDISEFIGKPLNYFTQEFFDKQDAFFRNRFNEDDFTAV